LIPVRLLHVLFAALLLNGCTFFFDVQDSAQPDPAPDGRQQRAIFDQIHKTMLTMKQAGRSEVSSVGPNEAQSGPERWTACTRANFNGEIRYFTFFVKGETVTNWRPAVINDRCEVRSFSAFEMAQ
jgi:hypothetical protein